MFDDPETDDEEFDDGQDGNDEYGTDGRWPPEPCVLCDVETQLRCSGCHRPVCHNCPECPNRCDGMVARSQQ